MKRFLPLLGAAAITALVLQGCSSRPTETDLVRIESARLNVTNCKNVAVKEMQVSNIMPGINDNYATVEFKYRLEFFNKFKEFKESMDKVELEEKKEARAFEDETEDMGKRFEKFGVSPGFALSAFEKRKFDLDELAKKHIARRYERTEQVFGEGCDVPPRLAVKKLLTGTPSADSKHGSDSASFDFSETLSLVKSSNGWIVDSK